MMIKQLIIGRVLPLGLAGLFLQSSVSPIRPALNAFAAATDALAGRSSDHVEANFPGTAGAPPHCWACPARRCGAGCRRRLPVESTG